MFHEFLFVVINDISTFYMKMWFFSLLFCCFQELLTVCPTPTPTWCTPAAWPTSTPSSRTSESRLAMMSPFPVMLIIKVRLFDDISLFLVYSSYKISVMEDAKIIQGRGIPWFSGGAQNNFSILKKPIVHLTYHELGSVATQLISFWQSRHMYPCTDKYCHNPTQPEYNLNYCWFWCENGCSHPNHPSHSTWVVTSSQVA